MESVRPEHEDGGKIILPGSALGAMASKNLEYPLLFKLTNEKEPSRATHCGVLEFTAREGNAYIPFWMMQNIRLNPNEFVVVTSCSLPRATFVKLQPQSVNFLDISNPKAVLEKTLRKYSAMTLEDIIAFRYNEKEYKLKVLELKPEVPTKAVSIVEADVNVDFAPPIGYKEPDQEPKKEITEKKLEIKKEDLDPSQLDDSDDSEEEKQPKFLAFSGTGSRISGKTDDHPSVATMTKNNTAKEEEKPILTKQGAVVYKPISEIELIRKQKQEEYEKEQAKKAGETKTKEEQEKKQQPTFQAFSGKGYRMK